MRMTVWAAVMAAGVGQGAGAVGHYCDDAPAQDLEECRAMRFRSDDDCTRVGVPLDRLACWDRQDAVRRCASPYGRSIDHGTEAECLAALQPLRGDG